MNIPKDLKFTKDHEWVKMDGKIAKVGITDFAQAEMGDIVYVELPDVDDDLEQGDTLCTIESTKAASDMYVPVSGKCVEVNETLEDTPELVNEAPYEGAWICKIEITDDEELDDLLTAAEYEKLIKE